MSIYIDKLVISDRWGQTVVKAHNKDNHAPVILKSLKTSSIETFSPDRLKKEYELIRKIQSPRVIKAIDYIEDEITLVLEHFGNSTLTDVIKKENDTVKLLRLACQIAEGVGDIHRAKIIHKDISPENILVDTENELIKIIDFEIATQLSEDFDEIIHKQLEGSLPYISPEQTGRMNVPIDYRSDIYSLGITLYYLFTKKLPFESKDLLEIIHAHIAKLPIPPHEEAPHIPYPISKIIMKCLQKTPEKRYRSAYGVMHDLEKCLHELEKSLALPDFEIGQNDIIDHFFLPARLFGRKDEIQRLLTLYEESTKGAPKLLVISGYSGVGKSSLIDSINSPVRLKKGHLIKGKFEAFKKQIPYYAIIQALNSIIEEISLLDDNSLTAYREKIKSALRENGQVLIDLVPSLANIIGPQPEALKLGLEETYNRLNYLISSFLGCFLEEEGGLVLSLDDVQWADEFSLEFINQFLSNTNYKNYLIILSYRENEVFATHPINRLLKEAEKKIFVSHMHLQPLKIESVKELIEETFQTKSEELSTLSQIIYKKTDGNPFFVKEFLRLLSDRELIFFDHPSNQWAPLLGEIESLQVSINVADILIEILSTLDSKCLNLLKVASAIGNNFEEEFLAALEKTSSENVRKIFIEALKKDLIEKKINRKKQTHYFFTHDRILQELYNLWSDEDKQKLNLKIARFYSTFYTENEINDRITELTNFYNEGRSLIQDPIEIQKLIKLNYKAGLKAKSSGAYKAALDYFKIAHEYLDDTSWTSDYELTYHLKTEKAVMEQMAGNPQESEKDFSNILENVRSNKEKIRVYSEIMILFIQKRIFQEAFDYGYKGLDLTSFKLPKSEVSSLRIIYELLMTQIRFLKISEEDLKNLEMSKDPDIEEILKLMSKLVFSGYMLGYNYLLFYTLIKMYQITLKYGMTDSGIIAISLYSNALCWIFAKQYEKGQKLMRAVLEITQKNPRNVSSIEAEFYIYNIGYRWIAPFKENVKPLEDTAQKLVETGNLPFAGASLTDATLMKMLAGYPLKEMAGDCQTSIQEISRFRTPEYVTAIEYLVGFIDCLEDKRQEIGSIELKQSFKKEKIQDFAHFLHDVLEVWRQTLFGHYEEAIKSSRTLLVDVCLFANHPLWNNFYLYYTLALIGLAIKEKRGRITKEIKKYYGFYKKWGALSSNYKAAFYLLEAELARIENNLDKAVLNYTQAQDLSHKEGLVYEEGYASERLLEVELELNHTEKAQKALDSSLKAFTRWGSLSKIKQLKLKYSHFLTKELEKDTITTHSYISTAHLFDYTALIEASQAISQEIVLEKLVDTLMRTVLKSAGADKAILILTEGQDFKIQASLDLSDDKLNFYEDLIPVNIGESLCKSAVNLTIRTMKPLLLNDPIEEGPLTHDAYILEKKPQSLAVIPLIHQGQLKGLIYLENKLSQGAFTQERIQILDLLSSQISISITNSQFYSQLEEKVKLRTNELTQALSDLKRTQDALIIQEKLKEREIVKNKLGKYVSNPQILDLMLSQKIALEGEEKEITVLFCDIRSFTTFSEKNTPKETVKLLNSFYTDMVHIIIENGGIVDKFIGDAFMALFGAVDPHPHDATHAVIAAIQIQQKIKADYTLKAGIGINSGKVLLGNIGSDERLEYTAIGDTVNTASRIESLSKDLHASILISEHTKQRLKKEIPLILKGEFNIRGKENKVNLYEVRIDDPIESQPQT